MAEFVPERVAGVCVITSFMPSPLPHTPRGPRRKKRVVQTVLLACPKHDPQWEIEALQVLMKPKAHTKESIRHRSGRQRWPRAGDVLPEQARDLIAERLGARFELHRSEGEYFVAVAVPEKLCGEGLALGWLLSSWLPDVWFVYGRLFLKGGKFYRRQFGVKLNLVIASNVHLPRGVRASLRGAVNRGKAPSKLGG